MSGVEVIVFAEGPSDELFLKRVVAPALRSSQIFLKPQTLHTSRVGAGGAVTFDRLKHNVRNTLRQSSTNYLTTFLDLYALDTDIPGKTDSFKHNGPRNKATHIQSKLQEALVAYTGCRPDRLFPHIQPYELEGLFFSNTEAMCAVVPGWGQFVAQLKAVRDEFETPEHINDNFESKPSSRLGDLLSPSYRKTTHAPLIGERIGLSSIAAQCPHFAQWLERLQRLRPL